MFELPHVKTIIKTLLEGDAGFVSGSGPAYLKQQELINSLFIPLQDFGRGEGLDHVPEGEVPQILQKKESLLDPVAIQSRYPDPYAAEEPMKVEKWKLIGRRVKYGQLLG
jgi:hypothetical protein